MASVTPKATVQSPVEFVSLMINELKGLDGRISSIWGVADECFFTVYVCAEDLNIALLRRRIAAVHIHRMTKEIQEIVKQLGRLLLLRRTLDSAASRFVASSSDALAVSFFLQPCDRSAYRIGALLGDVVCCDFKRQYELTSDYSEEMLVLEMAETISFFFYKARLYADLLQTMESAYVDMKTHFMSINPYHEDADSILSRLEVSVDFFSDCFKVFYGGKEFGSFELLWVIPFFKENKEMQKKEDLSDRFLAIAYFAPALCLHTYNWCRSGVILSTDFIKEEEQRLFTIGIHKICAEEVCSLERLMTVKEDSWKTTIPLKLNISDVVLSDVCRCIDDFIFDRLTSYMDPIMCHPLSLWREGKLVIEDCHVFWKIINSSSIAITVSFLSIDQQAKQLGFNLSLLSPIFQGIRPELLDVEVVSTDKKAIQTTITKIV